MTMVTLRTRSTESVTMVINNTPVNCPYVSPCFNSSKLLVTFFAPCLQMIKCKFEQSLNINRQKYIYSLKDEGLLLKIIFWRESADMSRFLSKH